MEKVYKSKLKRGDRVRVIAGKDKGSEGKILLMDRKTGRLVVEGVNMISRHTKPRGGQPGQIAHKEAPINASNVMYLHKGKPTRLGYKLETKEDGGKKTVIKKRIAKSTGEVID